MITHQATHAILLCVCYVNNANIYNSKCIKLEPTDNTEIYGSGLFNWPYCSTPETCATSTYLSIDANLRGKSSDYMYYKNKIPFSDLSTLFCLSYRENIPNNHDYIVWFDKIICFEWYCWQSLLCSYWQYGYWWRWSILLTLSYHYQSFFIRPPCQLITTFIIYVPIRYQQ